MGFSLAAATGGYSLTVVFGLLITAASLLVEHGLWAAGQFQALEHAGFSRCGAGA